MRILTILTLALLICGPAALADNYNQTIGDPLVQIHHDRTFPQHYPLCLLKVSPMILEIKALNEAAHETEKGLLKDLVAAREEIVALRIVRLIEELEYDRQIDVLKIQARYARLDGRLDLEKKIKTAILEILDQELAGASTPDW